MKNTYYSLIILSFILVPYLPFAQNGVGDYKKTQFIDGGIGVKVGFSGGPAFSIIGMMRLSDNTFMDLSIGGFPEIVLIAESNLRYAHRKKWSPYIKTGIGVFCFFRGKGEGKSIKEIHLNFGISRNFKYPIKLSADIGIIYLPYFANKWIEDEFDEEVKGMIPIVPTIGVEFIYGL